MIRSFVERDAFRKPISFNDYIHKYILKNKATSHTKIQQILSFLSLRDVGTH